MPHMDGFELACALRALPSALEMHLVALTAWNDQRTLARLADSGFEAHLTKPASIAALLDTIATFS